MAEKQELVRKKRDLKDQVSHLEDKQKEMLGTKNGNAGVGKVSGTIGSAKKSKK